MRKQDVKVGMVVRINIPIHTDRGLLWGSRNGIVVEVGESDAAIGFHGEGAWTALAFGGVEMRSSGFGQIERFKFSEFDLDPPPAHYLTILTTKGLIGKEEK